MPRAVQFNRFGPTDELEVVSVDAPRPGDGEVRVRVLAAGLNPVDWKIVADQAVARHYGFTGFPSGNGNDLAGVVDEIGPGVAGFRTGDRVFGGGRFLAQADFTVARADTLHSTPDGLTDEQAGTLDIAGRTAMAEVRHLAPSADDTILVSAAAGGVGVLAAQLARRAGARVIGTASVANHDYLRRRGIEPVGYGEGMPDRIRELAPEGVTAVLDHHGRETIDLGLALGVPPERINSIADKRYADEVGVMSVGGAEAEAGDLDELAALIAAGDIDLPIDAIYPVERVREAYAHLTAGHLRGKVVLTFE
ncbi:NADP-dependent oxidoreductase [Glaciibacter flavus]|uniref:NADP-dependent oxidoreductase n=1 Tax=Orlajensenia flava TaxID=2565934 RepID=A0A4S4FYI9_9MICO|nr:NADP-dependent oxidoreductase [Glaciibacter flavus]THG35518.1 NADP-dependent oxidoreductase [Glaciibacter flavus]